MKRAMKKNEIIRMLAAGVLVCSLAGCGKAEIEKEKVQTAQETITETLGEAKTAELRDEAAAQDGEKQETAGSETEESTETVKTGWIEENGEWHFYDQKGKLSIGWIQDNGDWYFLGEEGKLQTGWCQDGDNWFWLGDTGAMCTGWQEIDGKRYFFNDSGVMEHDIWIGEEYLSSDGAAAEKLRNYQTGQRYTEDFGQYDRAYTDETGLNFYLEDAGNGMLRLYGYTSGSLIPQEGETILPAVNDAAGSILISGYRGGADGSTQSTEETYSVRLVQEGDMVRLELDGKPWYPAEYLAQKYRISLVDTPRNYADYDLSRLQEMFGTGISSWDQYHDPAFEGLQFYEGEIEYFAFEGTDLIFTIDLNSNNRVIGVCSKNPRNFFKYDGILTREAVVGQLADSSTDLDYFRTFVPELADTYARCEVVINGYSLELDYRIGDDVITAVYWYF